MIERGVVNTGDEVEIVGIKETVEVGCARALRCSARSWTTARRVTTLVCLLRGIKSRGGRARAGSGEAWLDHAAHEVHLRRRTILTKDEGGRHTGFFSNYRPQFYFRTTDVTGAVTLPEGTEMVLPGDNVQMDVTLIQPIAMDEGLRFAIREGGRTVGAGVVATIKK